MFYGAISRSCFKLNKGSCGVLLLALCQVRQSSFAVFSKHPHAKPPALFCDVEQFISSLLVYQPPPVYNLLVLAGATAWVCKVPFKRPGPCDARLAGPENSSCTCQLPSPTFCLQLLPQLQNHPHHQSKWDQLSNPCWHLNKLGQCSWILCLMVVHTGLLWWQTPFVWLFI